MVKILSNKVSVLVLALILTLPSGFVVAAGPFDDGYVSEGLWQDTPTYDNWSDTSSYGWTDAPVYDNWTDTSSYGWGDTPYYDTWADTSSYGWADTPTYDNWADTSSYNNWVDTSYYDNWTDTALYDGWTDTSGYDTWADTPSYGWQDTPSYSNWTDTSRYGNDVVDIYGSDTIYSYTVEDGVRYSYMDYASPGCGGGCHVSTPPSTPCCAQSTPIVAPRYASSYPSFPPITIPPSRPQPPVVIPPSHPSSNVATNTCTGNSCNTSVNNIDNSINSSFNTTQLAPATPQYLVQYAYPQPITPAPIYPQQGISCVITASPSSIQNGQAAILSWTSYGANYATLSDGIGIVAPNGTLPVRPNVSTTYTLTITGYGGTRSCTTYVIVSGMAPYVSLSQIPYTGFDLGTFGNAIYWLGLLSFALASAYLVLYYRGGAANVVSSLGIFGNRRIARMRAEVAPVMFSQTVIPKAFTPTRAPRIPETLPIARAEVSPAYAEASAGRPKDSMTFADSSNGETPRIIVNRS